MATLVEEASSYELATIHGPTSKVPATAIVRGSSQADHNVEQSEHGTPAPSVATTVNPLITKPRFVAIFLAFFIQGVNDSVTGALLPYIQARYQIQYAIASLVFVGNAVGFIAAVPFIQLLDRNLGRVKTLLLAVCCNIVAYSIIIAQPPFAVVAVCFGILGFGFSTILALDNSLVANSPNGTVLLGITQGGYGIGGTVAPLMGTAMASNGVRWSFFYFISLGLSITNAALFAWSFHDFIPTLRSTNLPAGNVLRPKARSPVLQAMRDRSVLFGSVFVFAYQGAEVTISGWVVSFLIDYRHGDPSKVGYVSAGFWAGITVGRFLLCPLIEKLGDRRCIFGLIIVWAGFHLIVWFAHDIIGDAVAVAIIGVLSGPIAPCATGVMSKLLDPSIQVTGVGMAWSIGSGGAAVAPFLTGLLAQIYGAVVLNPTCIVLCGVMNIAWLALPGRTWKKE
ncbi:Bypass of stop codon protein 6 [Pseudocercospora fuligena]|uniref:Bypass of stop codon protein 6 n=1 Tax=Pseudocercospora fuligena TaxID=685502 RepID=A0A8H6VES3_9PEZI|nr:Bypass of stop codon protein 6 [Pseudocercospora fuligena]